MCICDVSVDLGSANIGVTKHSLDTTKISTIHKKVGGERMTKGMRSDVFSDAGSLGIVFDNALNRTWCKATIIAASVDSA